MQLVQSQRLERSLRVGQGELWWMGRTKICGRDSTLAANLAKASFLSLDKALRR